MLRSLMLRSLMFVMLGAGAPGARGQVGGAGTIQVEPFLGLLRGPGGAYGDQYGSSPLAGLRLQRLYAYDRGTFAEVWVARREEEYGNAAGGVYMQAALLGGLSSILIDRQATGSHGLRVLSGLGLLRSTASHEWRGFGGPGERYENTRQSWNLAFSGLMIGELELTRGTRLQGEIGFIIMYALDRGHSEGLLDLELFWLPALRGAVGVAFPL